ncbi:MAG: hypothetical protein K6G73_04805 [Marinilabiliaceae bacterium]|nr:hypothetical protein [Marinilabiliaceae bacterium]
MKFKVLFTAIVAATMVACNGKQTQEAQEAAENTTSFANEAITVDSLLSTAETLVGKEVVVAGKVMHLCKRTHRRCFIRGSQEANLRIEAGEELGGFNVELIGSKIAAKGIVGESRLSLDYVKEQKERIARQEEEQGTSQECDAERINIEKMEQWMAEHDTDYYPVYFLTASDFEPISAE